MASPETQNIMLKTSLPDEIVLKDGTVLKCVVGGHLNQKPFLTKENTDGAVDCTKTNWGTALMSSPDYYDHTEQKLIIRVAKKLKLKYRKVEVLSRRLRGKEGLHGGLYRPTIWTFVEVKP